MNKPTNKKNSLFVFLCAILIIYVIDDHANGIVPIYTGIFPYNSFYMPMFVFISGYFYKQRNVIDSLYKKIKSLFLPYILLSVIGGGFCYLLYVFIGLNWYKGFSLESIVWTLSVGPYIGNVNFPLWFALMLFQVSITYILFRWVLKPSIVNDVILTVLFTASNIISVYISINGFPPSPSITCILRLMFYIEFYHWGYLFKTYFEEKLNRIKSFIVFAIVIGINAFLVYFCKFDITFPSTSNMAIFHNAYLPLVTSATGIIFYYKLARLVPRAVTESRAVKFIGENTFTIMHTHLFYLNIPNFYIYLSIVNGSDRFKEFPMADFIDGPWVRYNSISLLTGFFISLGLSLLTIFLVNKIKALYQQKRQSKHFTFVAKR
ncbi:MAG: acyltransferase [Paludibacteraceae bacterium]|nr:acyltransferase [Paludibacteraceae bacterium]